MAVPLNVPLPRASMSPSKPAQTAKEVLSAKAKAASAFKGKGSTPGKPLEAAAAPTQAASFDEALLSADWSGAAAALGRAGEAAVALVEAWLQGSNVAALGASAQAEGLAAPVRKAARRAVNILKARGVMVPEQARVTRLATRRTEVAIEATFHSPDAAGTMSITVASREESGRYHVAEVIFRDAVGILQAGSGWLSGSQLKGLRARAGEGHAAPAAVPIEWARFRVAEARKLNARTGQVLPLGFDSCRDLFEPAPETATHPMADLEATVTSEGAWALAPTSGMLLDELEFRGWFPDQRSLQELLVKVGERAGAEARGNRVLVEEALREETAAATDRFFSPEMRAVVAQRMHDAAISVRARRGDERAREVLSAARAVREAGLITSPPRDVPFLRAFFERGLSYLAAQGGGSLRVPFPTPPSDAAAEPKG